MRSGQRPIPAHYDVENDRWIFDFPFGVPVSVLETAATYVYNVRKQQYTTLPPGDRKEFLGRGLTALKEGRFVQRVATKGDAAIVRPLASTGKIIVGV